MQSTSLRKPRQVCKPHPEQWRQSIAIITDSFHQVKASFEAILHLIIKDDSVKPDYLTLVLNSIVVKMQAERDAGGSVIQHWKPSEIENVVIPILSDDIQKQITENIRESFALRARSQQLLELAKTAVEIAIEQGEDKAMELLTQNM